MAFLVLAALNIAAFALMGADKFRARNEMRRVPERVLLGLAIVGGAPGAMAGMYVFRHKTNHTLFRVGLPALTVLWCLVMLWLGR